MKLLIKTKICTIITILGMLLLAIVSPVPTYGIGPAQNGASAAQGNDQPSELFGNSGIFTTITNTLLFIIGALSVIMLIVGGLRYVISGGNSTAVTTAKNTILYAIVGLVVALLAYAAINFILTTLVPGSGTGGTNV
ncbi:MAG: hypothetical protein PWQ10_429 [Patescibacteria group bacterium]|nr:hypothetical protein [Patescibacteria group bacterium]